MDTVTTGMQTHGTGEGVGKNTVSVDMRTKKDYFRSVDQSEQLFPRLPNEITFCRIIPKLPWRAFYTLAGVSRAWRQAIQTHRVHDARIHSCSTDTLVVHGHDYRKYENARLKCDIARVAIFSVKDKLCYDLPPIPGHYRGVPWSCQCISLDGKIYIIGGAVEVCRRDGQRKSCGSDGSSKVYVFDLAGVSHWKECASMERGRKEFGCGVIDGKIYAFGGENQFGPVRGAEVYNPKVNAWSPIMPMASLRFGHRVLTLAEKIVVYGGVCYDPSYTAWMASVRRNHAENLRSSALPLDCDVPYTDVYHPLEDEWSVEDGWSVKYPFGDPHDMVDGKARSVFVVQGKLHLMTEGRIYVQGKPWTCIRRSPLPYLGPGGNLAVFIATVVVDDELLAGVHWQDECESSISGSAFLQSKGFGTNGTDNSDVHWKVLSRCPGAFYDFMCCIQL